MSREDPEFDPRFNRMAWVVATAITVTSWIGIGAYLLS